MLPLVLGDCDSFTDFFLMTLDSFEGLLVRYFAERVTARIPDVFPMIRLGLCSTGEEDTKVRGCSHHIKSRGHAY